MREWMTFRMQEKNPDTEPSTLLSVGRLTQQLMVGGYTMVETHRLNWIRFNQPLLTAEKYNVLKSDVNDAVSEPSFSESRFMLRRVF